MKNLNKLFLLLALSSISVVLSCGSDNEPSVLENEINFQGTTYPVSIGRYDVSGVYTNEGGTIYNYVFVIADSYPSDYDVYVYMNFTASGELGNTLEEGGLVEGDYSIGEELFVEIRLGNGSAYTASVGTVTVLEANYPDFEFDIEINVQENMRLDGTSNQTVMGNYSGTFLRDEIGE